ncbi:MAG: S8 family serine peptidase [Blastocatellia bacterium]|nr:S8 family serine peptidase [Blastocatellia bacterium]
MNRHIRWLPFLVSAFLVITHFGVFRYFNSAASEKEPQQQTVPEQVEDYRSPGGRHKLRVETPEAAAKVERQGGRLIADYGGFKLYETDLATADSMRVQNAGQLQDVDNVLLLNVRQIDTTTETAQALRTAPAAGTESGLRLVQFVGPVKDEWHQALEATGVQIVSYIPMNAYLVHGDAKALKRLKEFTTRAYVQWDGDYLPEYKIQPDPRGKKGANGEARPLNGGQDTEKDRDVYTVQLLRAEKEGNQATLNLINQYKTGEIRRRYDILNYTNIVVRLSPAALSVLAKLSDVIVVEPYVTPVKHDERQNQIIAGNLTGNLPTSGGSWLGYLATNGFTQAQFTASNFVVNVSDSGIDNGTTNPNHFALRTGGVFANGSRVQYARLVGTANAGSTIQGCDGHGNLNTHIIGGFVPDSSAGAPWNTAPHADASGFSYGVGVCPFVKVGSSVIFDPSTFTNPNYPNLESMAYNNGARVSSNSWGAAVGGAYNTDSQAYDALVRDAQPTGSSFPVAGNQEMTIVFSAGNSGSGVNTIGSPGTGKNIICVGAAENVQAFGAADQCGTTDAQADNANDIIGFSSRGPCDDSRIKPDIQAPGTHITGGVFQASQVTPEGTGTGANGACFDATGVCAGPGTSNFFPVGQQYYTASSGTSHSCPAVSGAAALIRQAFINTGKLGGSPGAGTVPSPAMVKNVMMTTARYMTGVSANDMLPSNNQGMGEMFLNSAFNAIGNSPTPIPTIMQDQSGPNTFGNTGETRIITGTVANAGQPFRVGLVWTDAPGATTGNAFNNNLNVTVVVNGQTYLGNVFAATGGASATGGTADIRNNNEFVFVPSATGNFTVTVTAANIVSDGVPGNADTTDQDFSLVILNGTQATLPSLAAAGSTLTAEGCTPGNSVLDPNETVTVNLSLQNVGTANTANLVATLQATGGVTSPSGAQTYGVVVAGGAAVSRSFSFTVGSVTCGAVVTATLQLQDGASNLGTVTYNFTTGTTTSSGPTSFSNTGNILIPASGSGASTGSAANPYPAAITVSGLSGTITKVTATLTGFTHTFADDVDVLLVGPGGQTCILMSDVGGANPATNLTFTLDDTAAASLPDATALASGTFKPTNFVADQFPAGPPNGGTSFTYPALLSAFNGTTPNGTWSLYVNDDASGDTGNFSGGWSLSITTAVPNCCTTPCPTVTVSPTTLPDGVTGTAYSQTITASGGFGGPFTFAVTAGALPTSLALSSGGVLSGTPTVSGTYNFTVTATGASGCTGSRAYTVNVTRQLNPSATVGVTGTSSNMTPSTGFIGDFTITTTLQNTGGVTLNGPIYFQVTQLQAGGNTYRLKTADDFVASGPSGGVVGSRQTVPGGPLAPSATRTVSFTVGIANVRVPFQFYVDLYAINGTSPVVGKVGSYSFAVNQKFGAGATGVGPRLELEPEAVAETALIGGSGTQTSPVIAAQPNNPQRFAVAADDYLTRNVVVRWTDNGGTSWRTQALSRVVNGREYFVANAPTLAYTPQGELLVAYTLGNLEDSANALVVSRLGDRLTFTPPVALAEYGTANRRFVARPSLAVNSLGTPFVAWETVDTLNDRSTLTVARATGTNLFQSTVADGAVSHPTLTVGPKDALYLGWQEWTLKDNSTGGEVRLAVGDSNLSFAQAQTIAATGIGYGRTLPSMPEEEVTAHLSIVADPLQTGVLFAVFTRAGDGLDVVLSRSTDNGRSWSVPVPVSDATVGDQFHGVVDVSPKGSLSFGYRDTRHSAGNETALVRLAQSSDGGQTFTHSMVSGVPSNASRSNPNRDTNSNLGSRIGLKVVNGAPVLVWTDNRNNNEDIFLKQF